MSYQPHCNTLVALNEMIGQHRLRRVIRKFKDNLDRQATKRRYLQLVLDSLLGRILLSFEKMVLTPNVREIHGYYRKADSIRWFLANTLKKMIRVTFGRFKDQAHAVKIKKSSCLHRLCANIHRNMDKYPFCDTEFCLRGSWSSRGGRRGSEVPGLEPSSRRPALSPARTS